MGIYTERNIFNFVVKMAFGYWPLAIGFLAVSANLPTVVRLRNLVKLRKNLPKLTNLFSLLNLLPKASQQLTAKKISKAPRAIRAPRRRSGQIFLPTMTTKSPFVKGGFRGNVNIFYYTIIGSYSTTFSAPPQEVLRKMELPTSLLVKVCSILRNNSYAV